MRSIVVDCSAFIACALLDEEPPKGLSETLAEALFVVPAIWPTEVSNAVLTALRKGRMDDAALRIIINSLNAREMQIETAGLSVSMNATLALARQHKLTVYDAAYLELAQRRSLPLATLDGDLIKAAKRAKVKLI